MILAELAFIICPEHKDANHETGAVHACGHNAQCAALIGIAALSIGTNVDIEDTPGYAPLKTIKT